MTDIFHSARRRIARSRRHTESLELATRTFFGANPPPFSYVQEPDPAGENLEHKIRFHEPFPDVFSDLLAEASDGLRSALDQACYAVAKVGREDEPRNTHFPFGRTSRDVRNSLNTGRSRDIPEGLRSVLQESHPHKDGNDLLWGLNRLRNANQHRVLMGVGIVPSSLHFARGLTTGRGGGMAIRIPKWRPAEREIIYAKSPTGAEFEYGAPEVGMYLTFDEAGILAGSSVVDTLGLWATEVERIVVAIETESRRLGLIA